MVPKDGIILGEGKHHTVYAGDDGDQVVKIPKKECPVIYERACKTLQFFQKTFPDFIPETDIFLGENDIHILCGSEKGEMSFVLRVFTTKLNVRGTQRKITSLHE